MYIIKEKLYRENTYDEKLSWWTISSILKVNILNSSGGRGPFGLGLDLMFATRVKKGSSLLKEVTNSPFAYVKDVCCRCQTVGHMLQQGLILHTGHERGAGKHGPHWRAHKRTAGELTLIQPSARQSGINTPESALMREERPATWQSTWIQLRLYRNPRVSSSAGSKNCSIYTPPPVRVDPRRGIPEIWLDLPCVDRGRLGGESQRRRWLRWFSRFLLSFVVLLS